MSAYMQDNHNAPASGGQRGIPANVNDCSAADIISLADKLVWNAEEVAKMCGLSQSAFHHWVRNGILPRPINGTRRYSAEVIRQALRKAHGAVSEKEASGDLDGWRAGRGHR
ncbi:helix-turn-helix domain-containing protein [Govanella unica]|uniref:MerR family transcriptional regulator n=1 Tax=Govanella unica TaxID=2975056 RepID=A0A9X3TVH8_9PROT|nr:MerR family transcriptional regulator [Govania unica]MDA5192520.1 MerR family transcriptional regulator [Govania unica]